MFALTLDFKCDLTGTKKKASIPVKPIHSHTSPSDLSQMGVVCDSEKACDEAMRGHIDDSA